MKNKEMIYIRCSISTSRVGSKCEDVYEHPKADWVSLNDQEKTTLLDGFFNDHVSNNTDGWRVAEDANGNEISGNL